MKTFSAGFAVEHYRSRDLCSVREEARWRRRRCTFSARVSFFCKGSAYSCRVRRLCSCMLYWIFLHVARTPESNSASHGWKSGGFRPGNWVLACLRLAGEWVVWRSRAWSWLPGWARRARGAASPPGRSCDVPALSFRQYFYVSWWLPGQRRLRGVSRRRSARASASAGSRCWLRAGEPGWQRGAALPAAAHEGSWGEPFACLHSVQQSRLRARSLFPPFLL